MTCFTASLSSLYGWRRENWYFLLSASKYLRLTPSERMDAQPGAVIAPSRMDLLSSGTMRAGSAFSCTPSPVQVGQAPKGLLKENSRGVSSSMERPQSSQA